MPEVLKYQDFIPLSHGADWLVPGLPMVAVDYLVEGAAVWVADQRQRPVGWVAERDQVGAEPVLGEAEQAPRHVLVADGRVGAADAEAGGSQHDAHRGLTEVVLEAVPLPLVLRHGSDERDRGGRVRHMSGAPPHVAELLQLPALADEDEVPGLPVLRGRGPAAGFEDRVKMIVGDRLVGKGSHVAPRRDRLPSLHGSSLAEQFYRR